MSLERRAEQAMDAGEVDRQPCGSKQAVLQLIKDGKADALSVSQSIVLESGPLLSHYAVTFHDTALGAEVRKAMMRGFGLS